MFRTEQSRAGALHSFMFLNDFNFLEGQKTSLRTWVSHNSLRCETLT
jgi:hypothetical protein